jgi:predicted kinase
MSYYVIIRGPLGVGKTTTAKALASTLHAQYISIDELLAKHGLDKVDSATGCIPTAHFMQVTNELLPVAIALLHDGTPVVLDGNFYDTPSFKHLLHSLSRFKGMVFTLMAPLEVCVYRDSHRKSPYGEDAAAAVFALCQKVHAGVSIDADQSTQDIIKRIVAKLQIASL